MKKSKAIAYMSTIGLVAGIVMISGENTSAMQYPNPMTHHIIPKVEGHKVMHLPKKAGGRIHAHAVAGKTDCVHYGMHGMRCTTEVTTTIGSVEDED